MRFSRATGIEFELADGMAVLLDMNSGKYFRLNVTGAEIWLALEVTGDPEKIAEMVVARRAVRPEEVRGDVVGILDDLTRLGMVVRSDMS